MLTKSRPSSCFVSSGNYSYGLDESANAWAGVFTQSADEARYGLLVYFVNVANTSSGNTPGNMNFLPFGQAFVDPTVWDHVAGGLQLLGGVFEVAAGAALWLAPEGIMTKFGGVICVAHGLDNCIAGAHQLFTGEALPAGNCTEQIVQALAQNLFNQDPLRAQILGREWNDALGFWLTFGAGVQLPRIQQQQAFRNGIMNARIAPTGTRTGPAGSFNQTHTIRTAADRATVAEIEASMRQNGWVGNPIAVAEVDGQLYILDGHHRVAAAARAGIPVRYRIVGQEELARDFGVTDPNRIVWWHLDTLLEWER